ncbi:MAG: MucR family transcriptional regulator [Rhizomicrobium sp.]
MTDDRDSQTERFIGWASNIVAAYVSNNTLPVDRISVMLEEVLGALHRLAEHSRTERLSYQKPAISIAKSITPDYLVCLEDGKRLKILRRYLKERYRLSPEQYRLKWSLPADYPMVAPNYAARRAQVARDIGLGKSRTGKRARKSRA